MDCGSTIYFDLATGLPSQKEFHGPRHIVASDFRLDDRFLRRQDLLDQWHLQHLSTIKR